MSIRALYGMPERGIHKRADVLQYVGQYINWAHAKMLALAMLAGGGAGYMASKLSAKGKADIATAKKSYQNERAMADIGYLKTRLEDEYAESRQDKDAPKSMRIV